MSASVIVFATVLAAIGAGGIFFLKRAGDSFKGIFSQPSDIPQALGSLLTNLDMWIGTGLYALAFLWMMAAISRAPLSLFYPVAVGINIVLTCSVGVLLLGEGMSVGRAVGVMLILCGVIIASHY